MSALVPTWLTLWWAKKRFHRNFKEIHKGKVVVEAMSKDVVDDPLTKAKRNVRLCEQQLANALRESAKPTEKQLKAVTRLKLARRKVQMWEDRVQFLDTVAGRIGELKINAKHVIGMQEVGYRLRSLGGDFSDNISKAFESMQNINGSLGEVLRNIDESSKEMVEEADQDDRLDTKVSDDELSAELGKFREQLLGTGAKHTGNNSNGANGLALPSTAGLDNPSPSPLESHSDSLRRPASPDSFRVAPAAAATKGLGTGLRGGRGAKVARGRVSFTSTLGSPEGALSDEEIDLEHELGNGFADSYASRNSARVPLLADSPL